MTIPVIFQYGKHKSAGPAIWAAVSRRIAGRGMDAEHQKCDFTPLTEVITCAITSGGTSLCRAESPLIFRGSL